MYRRYKYVLLRVPLPDPRAQATQLLPKMTTHDDVENYLKMFEAIADREDWPREQWARVLASLLTGEPQQAYFSMPTNLNDSYDELRKEILARVGLSPISAAQLFHAWEYNSRVPARAQAAELSRLSQHWLLTGDPSAAQVTERVVVDRFLRAFPRPLWQAACMRNPPTIGELVEAIELAEATQRREAGERAPPFPRRMFQERRMQEGTPRTVGRPAVPGTQDEPMPTEPSRPPNQAWLAGCVVHQEPPLEAPQVEVRINGRPYQALLDSGSAVSLVQPTVLPPRLGAKAHLPITCIHKRHPSRPCPACHYLGRPRLLARRSRNSEGSARIRASREVLASDSARDGESPSQSTNLFYDVFQQVKGGGAFAK